MKSLIFSAILFFSLIALVIANSIYIHSVCTDALKLLDSLSPTDHDGVSELCAFWHKHSLIFGISIHNSQIELMNELTEALKSAVAKRDGAEFQEYSSLLRELLEELCKNEEISFQSII